MSIPHLLFVLIQHPRVHHSLTYVMCYQVKGVGYERVLQEGDHSEVVVGDVLGTARELLRRATTATTATTTATTTTAATAATASTTTGTGADGASTSISEVAR